MPSRCQYRAAFQGDGPVPAAINSAAQHIFFHPDYTVGFGVAPNLRIAAAGSALADCTADREFHPALKTSLLFSCRLYYSTVGRPMQYQKSSQRGHILLEGLHLLREGGPADAKAHAVVILIHRVVRLEDIFFLQGVGVLFGGAVEDVGELLVVGAVFLFGSGGGAERPGLFSENQRYGVL